MSFYYILTSNDFVEKWALIHIIASIHNTVVTRFFFQSGFFQDFLFVFSFQQLTMIGPGVGSFYCYHCCFSPCMGSNEIFVSRSRFFLPKLGDLGLISSIFFFPLSHFFLLSFWTPKMCLILFYRVTEALLMYFHFFSLFRLHNFVLTCLSSLIISFIISILL